MRGISSHLMRRVEQPHIRPSRDEASCRLPERCMHAKRAARRMQARARGRQTSGERADRLGFDGSELRERRRHREQGDEVLDLDPVAVHPPAPRRVPPRRVPRFRQRQAGLIATVPLFARAAAGLGSLHRCKSRSALL
jgi:hypothetical protein